MAAFFSQMKSDDTSPAGIIWYILLQLALFSPQLGKSTMSKGLLFYRSRFVVFVIMFNLLFQ